MRYPAISPDGTEIAFVMCDIYKVSANGGLATRLTTHSDMIADLCGALMAPKSLSRATAIMAPEIYM